jgi:undecaprenyl phosphate-alpha-L-ara4FN deformylase
MSAYASIFGELPRCSAAPGWRATKLTLSAQDRFGFEFASDTRGHEPFYPEFDGEKLRTLQVPVTLPTLDELLIRGEETLDLPRSGIHVYCAHAEVEGLSRLDWFRSILREAIEKGGRIVPLTTVAGLASKAPGCEVAERPVPGRSSAALFQVRR